MLLEQFTADLVDRAPTRCSVDLQFSDRVLDALATAPLANASQVADRLGMSVRQLHRRSQFSFGYGPGTLARLLRLHRFLALASTTAASSGGGRLAGLAIDAGYSDHAHLAGECRAISGHTPSVLLSTYVPTFPDMSDPFKTAESLAVTMSG